MLPEEKDDELDEEYVKADKRASREAEPAEEPAPEQPRAEPQPPAEPLDEEEGERPDINVYSLLRMSIGMYIEQAWIHLGLRMDPNKNKVEHNLPYAKVAIDTVDFMVQKLQPDLDDNEKRELDLLLANLRMNYVQRV